MSLWLMFSDDLCVIKYYNTFILKVWCILSCQKLLLLTEDCKPETQFSRDIRKISKISFHVVWCRKASKHQPPHLTSHCDFNSICLYKYFFNSLVWIFSWAPEPKVSFLLLEFTHCLTARQQPADDLEEPQAYYLSF